MQMQFNKKHCYTITNLLGSTLPCGTSRHDADTIGSSEGEKNILTTENLLNVGGFLVTWSREKRDDSDQKG